MKLKFVGLLSGGKDSCYNIMKCAEHGHQLICLANLQPSEEAEEIHSFMYQTAGHKLIPSIAECFGVPLLRRMTSGVSRVQLLDYVPESEEDEVEDLYRLLLEVTNIFPEVKGVSCGAIVSNYQRFRVENEMLEANISAILVKVAGAGLLPLKHLGKSLQELLPTLLRLHERFGLDLCGEGGEYETIVTDCPLFVKRLVVDDMSVLLDEEDDSVGNLLVTCHHLEDKTPEVVSNQQIETLNHALDRDHRSISSGECCTNEAELVPWDSIAESCNPSLFIGSDGLGQSSVLYPRAISGNVGSQVSDILSSMKLLLEDVGCSLSDIAFIHLYVSDMDFFDQLNEEYCKWFQDTPPSRSCVQLKLPGGVHVAADFAMIREQLVSTDRLSRRSSLRQALHVRSISEWAPVCIGPYSQANLVGNSLLFVAGQIPLVPATMTLDSSASFENQVELSLQHVRRIQAVMKTRIARTISCTVFINTTAAKHLHSTESEVQQPIVDGNLNASWVRHIVADILSRENPEDGFTACAGNGDDDVITESKSFCGFPERSVLCVGVTGLPRGAVVEVEVIALADSCLPGAPFSRCERTSHFTSAESLYRFVRETYFESAALLRSMQTLNSLPFWGGLRRTTTSQGMLPDVDSLFSKSGALIDLRVSSAVTFIDRCFCSGVLLLDCADGTINKDQDLGYLVSWAVWALTTTVVSLALSSSMTIDALQSLRIFCNSSLTDSFNEILLQMKSSFSHFGNASISLVLLPNEGLATSELFQVNFLYFDLTQCHSENWILE